MTASAEPRASVDDRGNGALIAPEIRSPSQCLGNARSSVFAGTKGGTFAGSVGVF